MTLDHLATGERARFQCPLGAPSLHTPPMDGHNSQAGYLPPRVLVRTYEDQAGDLSLLYRLSDLRERFGAHFASPLGALP